MEKTIQEIIAFLKKQDLTWATCESFTGGGFANAITNIPGASQVYWGGYITYSKTAKIALGVAERVIKKDGLVAAATALEMALATQRQTNADLIVSFTGNAGPTAQDNGQVGQAFVGCWFQGKTHVWEFFYPNLSRKAFKEKIIDETLLLIWDFLQEN
ncbi:nicotinamide-nucleotide amidase [Entomoplasma freundtii]|uniref:Competence damage-inducible protein A n=1 Tax=Entomoplasma freundtii TaxID=74700 RepID=A0A2K8NRN7_9MOLU|nr:nicotinamide-nucleotide amidohydrolase family protein [Entomoplasma freundtii]ATZ16434.1 competence damage-inducible protein A [Entomoplasma freundtii]TDY55964.1 nicotinamide-nucleotide amidase [Entomoplasma freundtii]